MPLFRLDKGIKLPTQNHPREAEEAHGISKVEMGIEGWEIPNRKEVLFISCYAASSGDQGEKGKTSKCDEGDAGGSELSSACGEVIPPSCG